MYAKKATHAGIDAGGTLIKIAYRCADTDAIYYRSFSSRELKTTVVEWIRTHLDTANLCITGGRAAKLLSLLKCSAKEIVEFDATCRGIQYILEQENKKRIQGGFVLTNVGTGTSIHYIENEEHERLGGTGVGGGTLIGLSMLLTGVSDFDTIVKESKFGKRNEIDMKVSHIYEGGQPPIMGDLTASNFGNVDRFDLAKVHDRADLLAAVVGLVGETVATISVQAAAQCGTKQIVFIGSSFANNDPLVETVKSYTHYKGATPYFPQYGQYSGALGALLHLI